MQNAPKCVQNSMNACKNADAMMHGQSAGLTAGYACKKCKKGPECNFKNIWDINAMHGKQASIQKLKKRTDMQF